VCGRTLRELNPAADLTMIERYAEVARTGTPMTTSYVSKSFHRHLSVFCFSPRPGYIASLTQDITPQKLVEQQVLRREAQLRAIAGALEDLVWLRSDSEMEYLSPSAEEVMGLPPDSYAANSNAFFDAMHEDDRARIASTIREAVAREGTHRYELQYRIRHPRKGVRWIRTRTVPLSDGRRVGIAHDVTAEREREAAQRVRHETEAGERASGLRELRAPLHDLVVLARQLLVDQPRDDQRDALETLRATAEQAFGQLDALLEASKRKLERDDDRARESGEPPCAG